MNLFDFLLRRKVCAACEARDYTIATLKEIIHQRDEFIMNLELKLEEQNINSTELINHLTGKRALATERPAGQLHSIPRQGGIQSRIAKAEASERNDPIIAQRRKEYDQRIENFMKSEVEVSGAI